MIEEYFDDRNSPANKLNNSLEPDNDSHGLSFPYSLAH